ncbi:distal tail protein Dit [Oceanobacillus alkalisoli]|uniref:distal tail protein Dit n=1 Tax=Oceanobacillus alkalisoli TaxID=2925113 RepID=UPI001F120A20|nr:distal tail protein Dit [Oceanobacillus alkalisoli]MCF3942215.1 phage tail family protein [Oceanobacillus alkalisoli]
MFFNGIDLSPYFRIKDIRGRGLIQRYVNGIPVAGMEGEHFGSINTPQKYLEIDVRITGEDLRKTIDELNSILATNAPVPIIFPDEPEMTYWGIVETSSESGEKFHLKWHDTTIIIRRSDPFKYGPERTRNPISDTTTISNRGTAEADPIIEVEAKESITYAMVQNQNDLIQLGEETYPKYTMVGRPYDVEEKPFEKYQRVYYSNASDLVGWTTASNSDIDGGIVTGNIVTRGGRFVADSYGEGSNWHGPAIKTSIERPIRDFRLSAFVGFLNESEANMVGRLEIYLLDINGNAIAKMALKDTSAARAAVFAEMRAGDRNNNDMIISGFPTRETGWNNFSGQLRISREWDDRMEENVWSAYVALVDTSTGRHHGRRIVSEWRDGGRYTNNVAQIVIHMGTVGTHNPIHANSGVSSVILQEIVQEPEGVPYIAHAGDIITFDSKKEDVFINGEPRNDLLDFGSDFIQLAKGENLLVFHPSSFRSRSVKYREKFR